MEDMSSITKEYVSILVQNSVFLFYIGENTILLFQERVSGFLF